MTGQKIKNPQEIIQRKNTEGKNPPKQKRKKRQKNAKENSKSGGWQNKIKTSQEENRNSPLRQETRPLFKIGRKCNRVTAGRDSRAIQQGDTAEREANYRDHLAGRVCRPRL